MANIEQKFREACTQSGLASMLNQLNNAALNGLLSATLNILKQSASANTITGSIKSIGQKENVSKQNEYFKRVLVLDCSRFNPDDGKKIENYVQLNFTQKHCDDLDGFAVGERVEVRFRLGGREWNGKIINDIVGLGIERVDGQTSAVSASSAAVAPVAPQPPQTPAQAAQTASSGQSDTQDALPF